jgi:hypothetical protein
MIWLNNTDGKKDACLTFATWAVIVCILKVLAAGASVKLGDAIYSLGVIDAGIIGALLTPTLGAYVARRYTDKVSKE